MILFETGILDHWSQSKVHYITMTYVLIFNYVHKEYPDSVSAVNEILKKDDNFDSLKEVTLSDTRSTFMLLTYLILICQLVMFCELFFPYISRKYSTHSRNRNSNSCTH